MNNNRFYVGFATTDEELNELFKLRYEDIVLEYSAENIRENKLDIQEIDKYAQHIIVKDMEHNGQIVGYYRMLTSDALTDQVKFICEQEYNIDRLKSLGYKICEFSRAVVKKEYRGGIVVLLLWRFIVDCMRKNNVRFLIGDASFFGTDRDRYLREISYLVNNYSIPDEYQITSRDKLPTMRLLNAGEYDESEAARLIPPLIKAYIALGGKVSRQTFTDTDFCSVDLFVLVDLENCNEAFINRIMSM